MSLTQPYKSLGGKIAIVTGAGSRAEGIGNGRAAAILLARQGAKVALLDMNKDWAQETARLIETEVGESIVIECDVSRPKDCEEAVAIVIEKWGRLDILINNVGISGPSGTALDVDLLAWDEALRVNVTSMMLMARFSIPHMCAAGGGAIVNIASVAGLVGGHHSLLYPTSKGAVINMTRSMATHHGKDGVRVNCIAPGMVYTPMVYSRDMSEEMRESRRLRSLLQTEGTGWDVGHAVIYLVSEESRWITGIVLPVDAGATAGIGSLPVPPNNRSK